jgi:hypothetical protein
VRRMVVVSVALLGMSGATWAQGVSPVDCPPGFRCLPDNSPAGDLARQNAAREQELAEQRRALCQMNARLNEDIAVGSAAIADPGNAWAARSALDDARLNSACR